MGLQAYCMALSANVLRKKVESPRLHPHILEIPCAPRNCHHGLSASMPHPLLKYTTLVPHYIVSLPLEGALGLGLYPKARLRSLTTLWGRGVTTTPTGEFDASYYTASSRLKLLIILLRALRRTFLAAARQLLSKSTLVPGARPRVRFSSIYGDLSLPYFFHRRRRCTCQLMAPLVPGASSPPALGFRVGS
ncbi:hypothetical protein BJV74DRAFT_367995 [Russula compacta]|nr:hypothetical protein BJV74DRAFT_367995 [Russula compacta]